MHRTGAAPLLHGSVLVIAGDPLAGWPSQAGLLLQSSILLSDSGIVAGFSALTCSDILAYSALGNHTAVKCPTLHVKDVKGLPD